MINKISLMHKSSQDSNGNMFVEFHWEEILLDGERTCTYQDGSGYSGFFKTGLFSRHRDIHMAGWKSI